MNFLGWVVPVWFTMAADVRAAREGKRRRWYINKALQEVREEPFG